MRRYTETLVAADGPSSVVVRGTILADPAHRVTRRYIVSHVDKASAWVNTYPLVSGEQTIPFSWAVINTLDNLGFADDLLAKEAA